MDVMIKKIAALGVPGLILTVAIELTGLAGAAALTTALAALGPGGMIGGIMTLCIIGCIADAIAEFGFDAIAEGVVRELYARGESAESLRYVVSRYPVSRKLKNHLYEIIDREDL